MNKREQAKTPRTKNRNEQVAQNRRKPRSNRNEKAKKGPKKDFGQRYDELFNRYQREYPGYVDPSTLDMASFKKEEEFLSELQKNSQIKDEIIKKIGDTLKINTKINKSKPGNAGIKIKHAKTKESSNTEKNRIKEKNDGQTITEIENRYTQKRLEKTKEYDKKRADLMDEYRALLKKEGVDTSKLSVEELTKDYGFDLVSPEVKYALQEEIKKLEENISIKDALEEVEEELSETETANLKEAKEAGYNTETLIEEGAKTIETTPGDESKDSKEKPAWIKDLSDKAFYRFLKYGITLYLSVFNIGGPKIGGNNLEKEQEKLNKNELAVFEKQEEQIKIIEKVDIKEKRFVKNQQLFDKLNENCKRIYLFNELKAEREPYIIADKPTASLLVFDKNNRLVAKFPALFGATPGERPNTYDLSNPNRSKDRLHGGATTPAGSYGVVVDSLNKQAIEVYGGKVFRVIGAKDLGIHPTYPPEYETRTKALESETVEDNKLSGGCINISQENFDEIEPYFRDTKKGLLYITPDNEKMIMYPGY